MLGFFRNERANVLQSIIGVALFSTNAHKSLHAIFGRIGLSVAYSTTIARLHTLGEDAAANLKSIGRRFVAGSAFIHIVYDNINQYRKSWRPSLNSQTALESGTAATLIMQDVDDPTTFDGPAYEFRRLENQSRKPSFKVLLADIDTDHTEGILVGIIMKILLEHIPYLQKHQSAVDAIFTTQYARHRAKLRQTEHYPMACSAHDEATTSGNKDVVRDLLVNQLGITPQELDQRIVTISGDQLSIQRLRTLKEQTKKGHSWYSAHRYIVPLIEMWHMQATFLKGIFRTSWAPTLARDDFGLRHAATTLGRKINADKVDFYPCDRLAGVVLQTMTLNYARFVSV